jgi:hypothetical protein
MEEHMLRVFENRVLRKTFRPKTGQVIWGGKDHMARSCMICIPLRKLFGRSKLE